MLLNHFIDKEVGVTHFTHLHPAQHLPHNDFDVLVVDLHALQAVDLLNLIHHVPSQRRLTLNLKDVMRV
jgi:hypothetical protein